MAVRVGAGHDKTEPLSISRAAGLDPDRYFYVHGLSQHVRESFSAEHDRDTVQVSSRAVRGSREHRMRSALRSTTTVLPEENQPEKRHGANPEPPSHECTGL